MTTLTQTQLQQPIPVRRHGRRTQDSWNSKGYQMTLTRVGKTKLLLTFLLIFLLFDYLTKDYLFKKSVDHIKILRDQYPCQALDIICLVFCEFGDKYGIALVTLVSYCVLDLPKSFTMAMIISTCQAMISILKSIGHQPRPFFVGDFKPYSCRFEHGDPSGHALATIGIYASFFELFIREHQLNEQQRSKVWCAALMLFAFMGFGRIYNAVHSYNQIISGYVWGYIIYYAFVHIFYYEICKLINTMDKVKGRRLYWNTLTQSFVFSYFVAMVLYLFNSVVHPTPQEWIDGIRNKCENVDLNIDPEMQNFEKFHLSFSCIGTYGGVLFEQLCLETKKYKAYNKTSIEMTLKRIVIGIPALLIGAIPLLVSKQNPFWIVVFFRNAFPTFLGSFLMYGTLKLFYLQLGLINTSTETTPIVPITFDSVQDLDESKQTSDELK